VLYRYVFNLGQQWTEEVAISLMVWSVFLGCNMAIRKNAHIKVEIFITRIPKNYKRWVMVLIYLGILLFLYIVFRYGLDLVYILKMMRSPALRFRMYWLTISIPIGFGLSFLQVTELLILELKEIYSELSKRSKI
jgi:TRAP-type C4-dicarboxylate transport system permease small subunit